MKKWVDYAEKNLWGEKKNVKKKCAELNYDERALTKYFCGKSYTKLVQKYASGNH